MNNQPTLPSDRPAAEVEADRAKDRAAQQILYGHAASLCGNDSFRFFLENVVGKRVKELAAAALDRRKTTAERDEAVALHDEIKKINDWATETMQSTNQYLKATESES